MAKSQSARSTSVAAAVDIHRRRITLIPRCFAPICAAWMDHWGSHEVCWRTNVHGPVYLLLNQLIALTCDDERAVALSERTYTGSPSMSPHAELKSSSCLQNACLALCSSSSGRWNSGSPRPLTLSFCWLTTYSNPSLSVRLAGEIRYKRRTAKMGHRKI